MAIPVDHELFSTGRAGKSIVCFPPHQVQMVIPPLIAASVRAEAFPLPARILCDRFATLFTDSSRLWRCKAIPPAERFYCVDRNPKLGSYAAIPCSIPAQRNNLLFLFVISFFGASPLFLCIYITLKVHNSKSFIDKYRTYLRFVFFFHPLLEPAIFFSSNKPLD